MAMAHLTLEGTGSHWITLGHNTRGPMQEKEEVFFYFTGTWRGETIRYSMQARRYSGGMDPKHYTLTAWQISGNTSGCHVVDAEGNRGGDLTDTARSRLSDIGRPTVERWLSSEEYDASATSAWAHAVLREISDSRSGDTAYVRATVEMHYSAGHYPSAVYEALRDVCDAKDAVRAATDSVGRALRGES